MYGSELLYIMGVTPCIKLHIYRFGKFPQLVSLSFFAQNSRGHIPVALRLIAMKPTA